MRQLASLVAAAVLIISCADGALAGKISHHGTTVEAEGSAMDCLSCHDGTTGKNIPFCTVKCDIKDPHSILRRYPPRGKEQEYAPPAAILARGIKLENGKVTCISCHDLGNNGKNHIIKLKDGSDLCGVCHIKM